MKVKNSNLLAATSWLRKINSQDQSIRFAFHVNTVINRVNAAIKVTEEMRQKIVKEHPLKDEKGEIAYTDETKQYIRLSEEGSKKLTELLDLETEIEFEQFSIDQLDANKVTIKPGEIEFLGWLIKA